MWNAHRFCCMELFQGGVLGELQQLFEVFYLFWKPIKIIFTSKQYGNIYKTY
ncbi:hypothetical protein OIU77_019897, partial [Salix suchowensis]